MVSILQAKNFVNEQRRKLPVVFGYLNNHATATLEELQALRPDLDVAFFYWLEFPEFRRENNWSKPEGAKRLHVFRPMRLIKNLLEIARAEQVYFHGFTTPRLWMIGLLWVVLVFGKSHTVLIASEGLKKKPSRLKSFFLRRLINSKKVIHLGIGHLSSRNFSDLGMSRWRFRKYCFGEKYPEQDTGYEKDSAVFRILSVGQLIQRKNHQRLIRAIATLSTPPRVVAHIAGSGELKEELSQLAFDLGVHEQVVFEGFCDHQKLHQLFSQADLFVLQSHYDGWGVVVGHAIHYGLPVCVSEGVRSGADFLVTQSVNGLIASSDSEFSQQLQSLVGQSEVLRSMGENSLAMSKVWCVASVAKRLGILIDDANIQFDEGPLAAAL